VFLSRSTIVSHPLVMMECVKLAEWATQNGGEPPERDTLVARRGLGGCCPPVSPAPNGDDPGRRAKTVVAEVGSGLNGHRTKLLALLGTPR